MNMDLLFLEKSFDGCGDGFGNGTGNGYGNGGCYGYGTGDGNGYGNGIDYGYTFGNGIGYGDGDGNGCGSGSGDINEGEGFMEDMLVLPNINIICIFPIHKSFYDLPLDQLPLHLNIENEEFREIVLSRLK